MVEKKNIVNSESMVFYEGIHNTFCTMNYLHDLDFSTSYLTHATP